MKNEPIENENQATDTTAPDAPAVKTQSAPEKRLKIFGVEFVYLYLLGIGFAFVGWLAENTVKAVSDGIIDSRFHTLPFI